MDVVFLLGGAFSNRFFIDNSVALVKRNFPHEKIFCVGLDPHIDGVINIPHKDYSMNKEANICSKILKACNTPEISDPFALFDDDHFVINPVDKLPLYRKYDLRHEVDVDPYTHALCNTRETLRELGLPTFNYEPHLPTLIEKEKFKKALSLVKWNTEKRPICCRSIYGNYVNTGVKHDDAKSILDDIDQNDIEDIKRKLKDIDYVSPSRIPTPNMMFFIESLVDNKGKGVSIKL